MTLPRLSLATVLAACAALLFAPAAGASPPVKGGFYDGNDGLTLQVNVAGTKVVRTYLSFNTRCNGRRAVGATSVPRNMQIRGGRFAFGDTRRFPSTGGMQKQVGRGRFIEGGEKVVLVYRQTINNPSTGQRCDTGDLRLVARTDGVQRYQTGAYEGSTGQGRKVTLAIADTADGYVDRFHTQVRLDCDRGPDITETLDLDMPLRDGRFEGRRRNLRADGTIVTRLSGRLSGTRVSGTVRATGSRVVGYTGPFDDIPVRATCDSGAVPFSARK